MLHLVCARASWSSKNVVFRAPGPFSLTPLGGDDGVDRLFSHSRMKSAAVLLMLPGERLLRMACGSSLSLLAGDGKVGEDEEGGVGDCEAERKELRERLRLLIIALVGFEFSSSFAVIIGKNCTCGNAMSCLGGSQGIKLWVFCVLLRSGLGMPQCRQWVV